VRRALVLAVGLAVAPPGLAAAPAPLAVHLAPAATVHGDEIVLADIADVDGDGPLAGRLRLLKIVPAPPAGGTLRLEAEMIRARLRYAQFDPQRVTLDGAGRVVVTRAFQTVRAADLFEAVRLKAQPRLEADARGEPRVLIPISRPEDLRVPTGELRLDVQLQESPPGAPTLAATLTVRVNGREYHRLALTFQLGRLVMVAVAARPLEPRRALSAADFRLERRPSTELPPDALSDAGEPADLEVLRPLEPGEVLTPRVIRPRLAVKRGELVTLLLDGAGFRITTQGRASEDARRGDAVRVVNVASKREVIGQVEGAGVVRVVSRPFGSE
jgi:flagella basal body P-ring formation protein FlgA